MHFYFLLKYYFVIHIYLLLGNNRVACLKLSHHLHSLKMQMLHLSPWANRCHWVFHNSNQPLWLKFQSFLNVQNWPKNGLNWTKNVQIWTENVQIWTKNVQNWTKNGQIRNKYGQIGTKYKICVKK